LTKRLCLNYLNYDEPREAVRSAGDTIDEIIKRIDDRLENEL